MGSHTSERPLALDTANALEQPLIAAIAAGQALGRGTRISVNLLIYQPASKSYSPWRGMTWKVPLESVQQGGQLAEGVDLLVRALALSPTVTLNTLREIVGGRYGIPEVAQVDDDAADGGDGGERDRADRDEPAAGPPAAPPPAADLGGD